MNASLMRMSEGQQRALALALLLLSIGVVLALFVVPLLLLHQHYDEAIAGLSDRIARYQRVAAQAPEYRKALEGMRERDARRFLLKNTAPNLAGAELQELVRAAVEGNGGRITTSQNQAPKEDGRFRQIGVNLTFFTNTQNLQKILYAIETQKPYLLVESVTVRPLNGFRGYRPPPGQEPEVNVQIDVAAFAANDVDKIGAGAAPRVSNSAVTPSRAANP